MATVVPRDVTVAVVIVTYNSGKVLKTCLEALWSQTRCPDNVLVVDNASPDPAYLESISGIQKTRLIRNETNVGFCEANNIGFAECSGYTYVIFLNPDAFLEGSFIESALRYMEGAEAVSVGILTGTLYGYDLEASRPSGRIDSMGISQTYYGRWYDRGHGAPLAEVTFPVGPQEVPAVCGALMFCRVSALGAVKLDWGSVFDSTFFMYKEDIDLSVRLRRGGWRLVYVSDLTCHHVRGWQQRSRMSLRAKYLSARNEVRVCFRNGGKGLPYSLIKLAYVGISTRFLN